MSQKLSSKTVDAIIKRNLIRRLQQQQRQRWSSTIITKQRHQYHYHQYTTCSTSFLIGGAIVALTSSCWFFTYLDYKEKYKYDNNIITSSITKCESSTSTTNSSTTSAAAQRRWKLRTRQTIKQMEEDSTRDSLESLYNVDWKHPLGQGSFGVVYLGINRRTNEKVAVKKISQKYTQLVELQAEMSALLHIRHNGGHPNICTLHENFTENGYYYLILDLINGPEMFDYLVSEGSYSELDASRLLREVASALAFLHGLNVIHRDLKPENLMLSTDNPNNAVMKLIDFGCATVLDDDDDDDDEDDDTSPSNSLVGRTLAYCPPEILDPKQRNKQKSKENASSMDMWAMGVILYVMLTAIHPFDLRGTATDEEVAHAIVHGPDPPLRNSPITAHLSESAIDLIEQLMQRDPNKRISAAEMLEHPWIRGVTANRDKIADSDKKLSLYREMFKSGIAKKVFQNIIEWSDDEDSNDISKRLSLIERAFRSFDPQQKGYLTRSDLQQSMDVEQTKGVIYEESADVLSLTGFSDLLAENMRNRYFPKGNIVYKEGQEGNSMYFINSGTISVSTGGSRVLRGPGDFFGEGALLHPKKIRSATIKCETPVHALEISREYFEQYLAKSDSNLLLTIKEKDKIRKKNRAKMILRLQKDLKEAKFADGETIFEKGDPGDSLFLVEKGKVHIFAGNNLVLTATPGNVFGEYSILTGRLRNCSAVCGTSSGCVVQEMSGTTFRKLADSSPELMTSLRDLCLRRDLKKAVVLRLKKEFPYDNPREAFDAVKSPLSRDDSLDKEAVKNLMRELNPEYTDDEILDIIRTLDLTNSGTVTFDEFKKVFVADIRKSASV